MLKKTKDIIMFVGYAALSIFVVWIFFFYYPKQFAQGRLDICFGSYGEALVIGAMTGWAFFYALLKLKLRKHWFAGLQVLGVIVIDMYQITLLPANGDQLARVIQSAFQQRMIFLLAGTAALGEAMAKLFESMPDASLK